jgi:NADH-quinone oxidoreductase subunit J
LYWALAGLATAGALSVVFARNLMRLALGLGLFFVSGAGLFALFGFGFLALAQVFIYVGGVLVLMLFAMMLLHRGRTGQPTLEIRHDPVAVVACVGIFGFLLLLMGPLAPLVEASTSGGVDALGEALLGDMLVPFELSGLLLLAALVSVVSVMGGDEK